MRATAANSGFVDSGFFGHSSFVIRHSDFDDRNCALARNRYSPHHSAFPMLTISRLTKAFGGRTLFADVTLQVNRQDRVGLVGPNGAGKTTLFSLILRSESPDEGEITFERNVAVGYLPQETATVGDETVVELATAISPEFVRLRRQVLAWDAGHPGEIEFHDNAHVAINWTLERRKSSPA